MKRIESVTSVVPVDIVVNVAFFIPDWTTLLFFLKALRSAGIFGPLEHLWQLHVTGWDSDNLWPHLDLRRINEDSQTHLEAIAKYFPVVILDSTMSPTTLARYITPKTNFHWVGIVPDELDQDLLNKWRYVEFPTLWGISNLTKYSQLLPRLHNLVSIDLPHCNAEEAAAVFKFAASSSTLRKVKLQNLVPIKCLITQDLLQWITAQPVQAISVMNFSWLSYKIREDVVVALLSNKTLQSLQILGKAHDYLVTFNGKFERTSGEETLDFLRLKKKPAFGAGRSMETDDLNATDVYDISVALYDHSFNVFSIPK
ncbi:hypothetical protein AeMF1_004727 [Aphanomyces euteiches]|nr:hypothetical protein AeMF1_004727 [Aphanomyces euteiches]